MFDALNSNYIIFLLVVTRISGALLFNPFFGRRNIPTIVKMGLAITIAAGIMPCLGKTEPAINSFIVFVIIIIKELAVGYVVGFIMQLVMSVALIAGEAVDMQLGLGMGKIYDPQSNVSMALTGTIYNLFFTLLFFMSNGHLTLIKLITESCKLFPIGSDFINFEAGSYIVLMFGDILILSLKLAIPILAIELLTEAGLGFMMRTVPHINIFSVGLQVKLAVGLMVVMLALPITSKILDSSMTYMFEKIQFGINKILTS